MKPTYKKEIIKCVMCHEGFKDCVEDVYTNLIAYVCNNPKCPNYALLQKSC